MTEKINNLKQYINENFLLTLTSKGIYNRSVKDIDAIINNNNTNQISIEEIDNKIKVIFDMSGEKIEVVLNDENIKLSKCTCPSKDVCKHIIMALLYIKYMDNTNTVNDNEKKEEIENSFNDNSNKENETTAEENNSFDELKNISFDNIKKLSTKKNFEYALDRFYDDVEVNIKEDVMLEIYIPEDDISIYFPKKDSIKNSICSCRDSSLCSHKIKIF